MEKVPQIVSERLRAASSPVDHPDADVLTAFSEHSLRKSERAAVLEHLARCRACRDIVALALPATEAVRHPVHSASDGWLTWPVLRWGFVTAGIVAITSFGIMQYQRRSSMVAYQTARPEAITKEAKNLPPASPSPESTDDRDKAPTAPPASALTDRKDLSPSNLPATPAAEMVAPAMGGPVRSKSGMSGGALPHGPRVQWQQNTNVQQQMAQAPAKQLRAIPPQSAPHSASSETVEVQSEVGQLASVDSSAVQNKIDRQALQNGRVEAKVERSKPAATTVANAPTPFPGPAKAQLIRQSAQAGVVPNASVRWTITAVGRLQRSLDQGTTWQDVDVNAPSATGSAGVALMEAPTKAKEMSSDILAKKDRSSPLTFRAVASNGPDVWAGTSGGLLYHSTDAGSNWSRTVPSASGVSLTGDIVSLEFVDPQHGRVVTSIPEIWTTSDGGQSWQKQ